MAKENWKIIATAVVFAMVLVIVALLIYHFAVVEEIEIPEQKEYKPEPKEITSWFTIPCIWEGVNFRNDFEKLRIMSNNQSANPYDEYQHFGPTIELRGFSLTSDNDNDAVKTSVFKIVNETTGEEVEGESNAFGKSEAAIGETPPLMINSGDKVEIYAK